MAGLIGTVRTSRRGAATGVWTLDEQVGYQRQGTWIGDASFDSVSLLLHMDGSNGSTTFTDSSKNALTVTASGNAQISTAQSKFGGSSLALDGTDDFVSIAATTLTDLPADFTIELWAYFNSLAADATVCGKWGSSNRCWLLTVLSSTSILFATGNNGLLDTIGTRTPTTSLAINTWYHLAVTRSGSTVRIFVNGVQAGTDIITTGNCTGTQTTVVGVNGDGNVGDVNGYIDDLRITKGVARYTANFTAPSAPFSNS